MKRERSKLDDIMIAVLVALIITFAICMVALALFLFWYGTPV